MNDVRCLWSGAWLGAACWLASGAAWALDVPGPVVDGAWLAAHRAEVTLLDVRPNLKSFTAAPEFETDKKSGKKRLVVLGGHIEGAVAVDNKKVRVERVIDGLKLQGMIPEQADFQVLARGWGVEAGKPVVIASAGMNAMDFNDAARLFWQFKVYGEDNVAVLDGGTAGWIDAGREISANPVAPAAGNWQARGDRVGQYLATSGDVVKAQGEPATQLIDARSDAFYLGLDRAAPGVSAPGHIAGAKNVFTALMSTPGRDSASHLLAPETYRDVFRMRGVDAQAPAITYCNTGQQAAGPWFVLTQILGNRDVRLYDGSMHEWTLEKRPTVAVKGAR